MLANAVLAAVRQAGDPTAFEEQSRVAGPAALDDLACLHAVYPSGNAGDWRLNVQEILPRRGTSVMNLAATGASRLIPVEAVVPDSEPYRLVDVAPDANGGNGALPALNDFFTGIVSGSRD